MRRIYVSLGKWGLFFITHICNTRQRWVKWVIFKLVSWINIHEHFLWYCPKVNSLAPGKFYWNFRHVIFKQILVIGGWSSSCEIALIWMSLDFTDDQSTLVQVMAWCRQATSHYLSQCLPRSLSSYGVTRPQWVNAKDVTDVQWTLIEVMACCLTARSHYLNQYWANYITPYGITWGKITTILQTSFSNSFACIKIV